MSPLSIVVITLNEEKRIGCLMEDLSKQTYRDFEVILVDSNSDDNTCAIAGAFEERLPELTVQKMEDRGVSLGRNTGAALAKHERILFLDADVRLPFNFLANAMDSLEERKLEIAGVYMGARELPMVYKLGYGLFNIGLFVTQFTFPTAVGACIFSTQRVHQESGGFDEKISLCEDNDYVKRASQTWRFRMLNQTFNFDPHRFEQEGLVKTGLTYLKANLRRFFFGEMRNNEADNKYGPHQELQ